MTLVATATVVASRALGEYRVLTLRAPHVASEASPGQFVNVAAGPEVLLRRPFSLYEIDAGAGTVSIAFDVLGPGTRWLAARAQDDALDVVGPLGRGFPAPQGPALLVGGGYGTSALAPLAARDPSASHAIVGARTASRLFVDDTLRAAASLTLVTDDGSAGARGVVTDVVPDALERTGARAVYACGPMRMLEAVAGAAADAGLPAHLAVEEFMACGVGVCWTCVLPVRANGSVKHLRSCTEGPVFEGAAVAWA